MADRIIPASPCLVVFADDWGRHASSCQHLIKRLQKDCRILWVNSIGTRQVRANAFTVSRGLEKLKSWSQGLQQVAERMWTIDLPMLPGLGHPLVRQINRKLVTSLLRRIMARLGMISPIVLTTLPYISWLIRDLRRKALIYYCTDDYSHWPSADREMLQQADKELSGQADLILAASRALFERGQHTGRCRYFPHGVDFAHFARWQDQGAVPPALARLPRPRIGYFGLIYEKLDFELLALVAHQFSQGSLVMIGPQAYCPSEFKSIRNVHLLGQQSYEELPRYIAGLDLLLLPYVDDDMIRQSGPLKLRECLASGKPTVSIDVPDVAVYQPFVRVAKTHQEFLQAVEQGLQEPVSSPLSAARQEAVKRDGWDQRAELLRSHLDQLLVRNGSSGLFLHGKKPLRKVLHLRTVSGRGGGPEKTILNSPYYLREEYTLRLAYIRPEGDADYNMPERARQAGVDLVDIPELGPLDPRTFWRLVQEIKHFQPNLLHAHDYKTNVLGILLGRMFNMPVMTTLHGYGLGGGRLRAYFQADRWTLRHMDHIVAVSEDLYQRLLNLKIPRSRCSLIHNAIDVKQYRRLHPLSVAKEKLGVDPRWFVIGAVGRLHPEKAFDVLIRSTAQLTQAGFPIELVIVGEGEERPRLDGLIAELQLQKHVRLLGYRTDVKDCYEAMDVFVLSSLREALPNALLEALAMEVPVVATGVGGILRLIQNEVNGLLVGPGVTAELTRALGRLLQDSELRQRLGHAGLRTVEKNFSFAARMGKIRAIYDHLLGRN